MIREADRRHLQEPSLSAMSGFSVLPPNQDALAPAEPPAADQIDFDGWWPGVNMATVRDLISLDTTHTPARLRDAIVHAMLDIATELADWRAEQVAAGRARLSDVPGRLTIGGRTDYELRWERAVCSVVGADLGEKAVGQGLSGPGAERREHLQSDIDVHQRNVRHAVRDFLGKARIRAELI